LFSVGRCGHVGSHASNGVPAADDDLREVSPAQRSVKRGLVRLTIRDHLPGRRLPAGDLTDFAGRVPDVVFLRDPMRRPSRTSPISTR